MYRTFLALLFLFVPIFFVVGAGLALMGFASVFMSQGVFVLAVRLGALSLGIGLVVLARKIFRVGREYLDDYDYAYVAWSAALVYVLVACYVVTAYRDLVTPVSAALIPSPFAVWSFYLFAKLGTRKRGKT